LSARAAAGGNKPIRKPAAALWRWQAALLVSLFLNLGLFLHTHYPYFTTRAPPHHHEVEHYQQTCLMQIDDAAAASSGRRTSTTRRQKEEPLAAGAPSTGKPAVTADSVINLDQLSSFVRSLFAVVFLLVPVLRAVALR
jgi:L-tryptophan--pyruvate aminotransferase